MCQLAIKYTDCPNNSDCAMCGASVALPSGPCLCADDSSGVCRECGKRIAPHLLALVDLAHAAERIGKSFRYLLVPPMESLLDLARAAENYSSCKQ